MFHNKVLLLFSILAVGFLVYEMSTGEEVRKQSVFVRGVFTVFSAGLVTVVYFGGLLVLHLILVLSSKHVGVLGSHTLEIKDEGLEESTTVNRSLHRWNQSFRIREFGNYVWIYPTDGQFFLIPKRQEGHEGDLSGFIAQLKTKIGKNTAAG
jgi:hypothetical protein